VVLVKPTVSSRSTVLPLGSRLANTIGRVELDSESSLGDILPFIQFVDKRWTLCVDCVPLHQVHDILTST